MEITLKEKMTDRLALPSVDGSHYFSLSLASTRSHFKHAPLFTDHIIDLSHNMAAYSLLDTHAVVAWKELGL